MEAKIICVFLENNYIHNLMERNCIKYIFLITEK